MSIICNPSDASASLQPGQHDHDRIKNLQNLTRTVGVKNLSRYLLSLPWQDTKHLINTIIYKFSSYTATVTAAARDGANTAPYPAYPPGQFHANNRDDQPDGLRRVTFSPSTAVPSDCLITKFMSQRIVYLKTYSDRYPNKTNIQ
jgi:hypothetical protein